VKPLLLDEGLYPVVADALRCVGLDARAVGHLGAPGKQSVDEANCRWCAERDAVLVTNDRGKKDKTIFKALDRHGVHVIFVHDDLRSRPPQHLLLALLKAEAAIDDLCGRRRQLLRRRLTPTGRLEKR
jgi:hypothetical protein